MEEETAIETIKLKIQLLYNYRVTRKQDNKSNQAPKLNKPQLSSCSDEISYILNDIPHNVK